MKWNILHKLRITNYELRVSQIQSILLKNRGIEGKKAVGEFLNPSLEQLKREFFSKVHVKKAIARIKNAIAGKELVIVYSDYDVDGITGTAILWEALRTLDVNTLPYVPHRMTEGYGLSIKGIDNVLKKHPDTKLIITVDNGISATEAVAYANKKGLEVIITDHHTKPSELPKALAIIHTTDLAGSGVALLFSTLLHAQINHVPEYQINKEHLALAAMGTIADLVPLSGANRVIATHGLHALSHTRRLGVNALIEEIGIQERDIGTYEVGFMIGPRINASGRLDHALDALRLLCTKSQSRAWMLATSLDKINTKRKDMMHGAIEHAKERATETEKILIVSSESYHEGVIGLVAGGLVDAFYKPAIVLSTGKKISKASARSVRGFNLVEAIRECSDLLINVGGHPMAAGFTIETDKLPQFETCMQKVVEKELSDDLLTKTLKVDMEVSLSMLNWDVYDAICALRPFGVGNPEPVFACRNVMVADATLVGKEKTHLKLRLKHTQGDQQSPIFDAIAFGRGELYKQLSPEQPIDIACTLSRNEWNGSVTLQLIIRDIKL